MPCDDCKTMPAKMTHTLTVERPGTTQDAAGQLNLGSDASWVNVGRIRARFVSTNGTESFALSPTQAEGENAFVIEATATAIAKSLQPSWRLRLGSRKLEITSAYLVGETGKLMRIGAVERRQ